MNRLLVTLILNLLISNLYSQVNSFEFKGQISLQSNVNFENDYKYFLGGRYLPELEYSKEIDSVSSITLLSSANFSASKFFTPVGKNLNYEDYDFYRLWIRYINKNIEYRLGLQKIDFGSALLIRPLQWLSLIHI